MLTRSLLRVFAAGVEDLEVRQVSDVGDVEHPAPRLCDGEVVEVNAVDDSAAVLHLDDSTELVPRDRAATLVGAVSTHSLSYIATTRFATTDDSCQSSMYLRATPPQ